MTFSAFTHIHKAPHPPRKAWKSTRTRKRIDALSERMGSAVKLDLVKGFDRFKRRIDPQKVYEAYLSGNYHKVILSVPWEGFQEDFDPSFKRVGESYIESGQLSLEAMPIPKDVHLRWDTSNPRVRQHIASRKAFNFTNLSEDSAKNIRMWTTASLDRALTPRQVAEGIKSQIGLLPAHAAAVEKYRQGLLSGGMPGLRAEALSSEYADRLLDYRATMIGRTETRLATNQGQLSVWRQAADQGLIDRHTTRKRWITAGSDPCDVCEPMDGKTVSMDGFWTLNDGTTSDCPPEDVHPHCDCTFDIVYGQEAEEEE